MLGFETFEELAARNLEESAEADYKRGEFRHRIEADGRVRGLEAVWVRKDGRQIFVRENAQIVRGPDGTPLFYEGSAEDITALKEVQEALLRSHEELEDRVKTRTGEVIHLNAELTQAYDATIEGWSRAPGPAGPRNRRPLPPRHRNDALPGPRSGPAGRRIGPPCGMGRCSTTSAKWVFPTPSS